MFLILKNIDINECKLRMDNCQRSTQICRNRPGSFECTCKSGYKMKYPSQIVNRFNPCVGKSKYLKLI